VPFRFSVERLDCLFNAIRVTRRDDCSPAMCQNLLRHR
jgi:hypothetical protein